MCEVDEPVAVAEPAADVVGGPADPFDGALPAAALLVDDAGEPAGPDEQAPIPSVANAPTVKAARLLILAVTLTSGRLEAQARSGGLDPVDTVWPES